VNLRDTLEHLLSGKSLSEAEAAELLRALTGSDMPPPLAGALLASLRAKGVTADEVRGSYWEKEDGTLAAKSVTLGATLDQRAKERAPNQGSKFKPLARAFTR